MLVVSCPPSCPLPVVTAAIIFIMFIKILTALLSGWYNPDLMRILVTSSVRNTGLPGGGLIKQWRKLIVFEIRSKMEVKWTISSTNRR